MSRKSSIGELKKGNPGQKTGHEPAVRIKDGTESAQSWRTKPPKDTHGDAGEYLSHFGHTISISEPARGPSVPETPAGALQQENAQLRTELSQLRELLNVSEDAHVEASQMDSIFTEYQRQKMQTYLAEKQIRLLVKELTVRRQTIAEAEAALEGFTSRLEDLGIKGSRTGGPSGMQDDQQGMRALYSWCKQQHSRIVQARALDTERMRNSCLGEQSWGHASSGSHKARGPASDLDPSLLVPYIPSGGNPFLKSSARLSGLSVAALAEGGFLPHLDPGALHHLDLMLNQLAPRLASLAILLRTTILPSMGHMAQEVRNEIQSEVAQVADSCSSVMRSLNQLCCLLPSSPMMAPRHALSSVRMRSRTYRAGQTAADWGGCKAVETRDGPHMVEERRGLALLDEVLQCLADQEGGSPSALTIGRSTGNCGGSSGQSRGVTKSLKMEDNSRESPGVNRGSRWGPRGEGRGARQAPGGAARSTQGPSGTIAIDVLIPIMKKLRETLVLDDVRADLYESHLRRLSLMCQSQGEAFDRMSTELLESLCSWGNAEEERKEAAILAMSKVLERLTVLTLQPSESSLKLLVAALQQHKGVLTEIPDILSTGETRRKLSEYLQTKLGELVLRYHHQVQELHMQSKDQEDRALWQLDREMGSCATEGNCVVEQLAAAMSRCGVPPGSL